MMTDRQLDVWIGKHVMNLPGVGHYRRKSWEGVEWEMCQEGDMSPAEGDHQRPVGADSVYFLIRDGSPFALPKYSTDIGAAFLVMAELEKNLGAVFSITTMHKGKYTASVQIRGCKKATDSFHSVLGEAVDDNPAKAICRCVYNAYGMGNIELSKLLALLLRHNPNKAGLTLDANGWADIKALMDGIRLCFSKLVLLEDIEKVVETNNKKRFVIDGEKIKACQGHSIPGIIAYDDKTPVEPPTWLYHGTTFERWEKIQKSGLNKMKRHDVHLSNTEHEAELVARRWKKETPCILHVEAKKMHRAGHNFFRSENGVWLTKHVPVESIAHVMDI